MKQPGIQSKDKVYPCTFCKNKVSIYIYIYIVFRNKGFPRDAFQTQTPRIRRTEHKISRERERTTRSKSEGRDSEPNERSNRECNRGPQPEIITNSE